MLLSIFGIVFCFAMPAIIFIYTLVYPESTSCYASTHRDLATEAPTKNAKRFREMNIADYYRYWAIYGLVFNLIMIASYAHAMRIPCTRLDLIWDGQVRLVRKIIYFTIFTMILFNASTVALRWEHNFRVCAGDLIDDETMATVYEDKIPNFYLVKTGLFMKIYCFFYVGIFCLVSIIGFLITLWLTFKTTYGGETMARDPDYEPAYSTAIDGNSKNKNKAQLGQVMHID